MSTPALPTPSPQPYPLARNAPDSCNLTAPASCPTVDPPPAPPRPAPRSGLTATALARQRQQLLALEEEILATIAQRVEEQLPAVLAAEPVQVGGQVEPRWKAARYSAGMPVGLTCGLTCISCHLTSGRLSKQCHSCVTLSSSPSALCRDTLLVPCPCPPALPRVQARIQARLKEERAKLEAQVRPRSGGRAAAGAFPLDNMSQTALADTGRCLAPVDAPGRPWP